MTSYYSSELKEPTQEACKINKIKIYRNLPFNGYEETLIQKILGKYIFKRCDILGKGSFSTVYLGRTLSDPFKKVAIKEINIQSNEKAILQEIYLTKLTKNENVIAFYDSYINHKEGKCYIILEYCNKGALDRLKTKHANKNIEQIYFYFKQIISGMKALYNNKIVHRDLKLANILLNNESVKISDFGLSKNLGHQKSLKGSKCGTPSTMAPEVYLTSENLVNYTNKCDIWALGIMLHELVYCTHPFGLNREKMAKNERVIIYENHEMAEDFINRALKLNPRNRIGWEEIFNHPLNFLKNDGEFVRWRNGELIFKEIEIDRWNEESLLNLVEIMGDHLLQKINVIIKKFRNRFLKVLK